LVIAIGNMIMIPDYKENRTNIEGH
jgi:hypothetical protein